MSAPAPVQSAGWAPVIPASQPLQWLENVEDEDEEEDEETLEGDRLARCSVSIANFALRSYLFPLLLRF